MMIKNKLKVSFYILPLLIIFVCFIYSQAEETVQKPTQVQNKDSQKLSVDLDFKDADIKDVARAFSRISGKNIIVSDEVKASITLRVQTMDWKEALNMVLGAYNITMLEKEDYIIITTFERRRLAEESGDLQTRVLSLNFVDVGGIQKTLISMLTPRGKIEADTRTNSLVITDIPERIDKIQEVALKLDTKTPQVMIEAIMMDLKLTDEDQLGIAWTITHKDRPERLIKQTLSLSGSTTGEIRYGKTLLSWANFAALVNFWQENKRVDILANPRVLTLDNLIASIDLSEQVPYTEQTTSDQGTVSSTQFKDVGIKLYVKPHITKDNYIFMNIKTEQSFRSGWTPDNQPIVDSRKAETNLMVKDGETVVIGGLRKKEDTTTVDKIPLLGDIPIIGNLFKRNNKAKIDTELLIFVTPHIAADTQLSEGEAKQLERFKEKIKKTTSSFKQAKPFPLRAHSVTK